MDTMLAVLWPLAMPELTALGESLEVDYRDRQGHRLRLDVAAYQANLHKAYQGTAAQPFYHYLDPYEPEWACPDVDMLPRGLYGDGHKWMCGLRLAPARHHCLVYSFGSRGEDGWERAIAARLPGCEIHICDPSLQGAAATDRQRRASAYNATFHTIGLTGSTEDNRGEPRKRTAHKYKWRMMTLQGIREKLGHTGRKINYLKVRLIMHACMCDRISASPCKVRPRLRW